eukprot:UN05852
MYTLMLSEKEFGGSCDTMMKEDPVTPEMVQQLKMSNEENKKSINQYKEQLYETQQENLRLTDQVNYFEEQSKTHQKKIDDLKFRMPQSPGQSDNDVKYMLIRDR